MSIAQFTGKGVDTLQEEVTQKTIALSCCTSGSANMASRTAADTKMDLSVFPETDCQGFFNQIHKKSTKKVPEAPYGS